MARTDPNAGRAFIWLVACILFLSIIAGGGCLLSYMISSKSPSWLPIAGVTLVCLPWAFWLLTFLYRVCSRTCGFRVSIGNIGSGGGGGGTNVIANKNTAGDVVFEAEHVEGSAVSTPSNDANQNQVGGAGGKCEKGNDTSSRSSSVNSHESEMPLASSMAH